MKRRAYRFKQGDQTRPVNSLKTMECFPNLYVTLNVSYYYCQGKFKFPTSYALTSFPYTDTKGIHPERSENYSLGIVGLA